MPPKREATHGTTNMYRYGCRCTDCRDAHADESARLRREAKYGPGGSMGPEVRKAILKALRSGKTVKEAAELVGVTWQAVYGASQALPDFGDKVREVTAAP